MKKLVSYRRYVLVIIGLITVAGAGTVLAGSDSGQWYKNGATMRGSHNANFVGILDRRIDANSNVTIPTSVIESISVFGYLQDRCANADGTFQPWDQFVATGQSASWASTVSMSAQGTYQTCTYGPHQYRNKSLHIFQYPSWSLNEAHWLCSGDSGVC